MDRSNVFWSGPNHFGQAQIIKISPEKSDLNLTKILDPTKTVWTPSKHFFTDNLDLITNKNLESIKMMEVTTETIPTMYSKK